MAKIASTGNARVSEENAVADEQLGKPRLVAERAGEHCECGHVGDQGLERRMLGDLIIQERHDPISRSTDGEWSSATNGHPRLQVLSGGGEVQAERSPALIGNRQV